MKLQFDNVTNGRRTQIGASFQVRKRTGRTRMAVFQCECGNIGVAGVSAVRKGAASCGCRTVESLKRGEHNKGRVPKHGRCGSKVYHAWSNIVQRCENPNNKHYANYGGRGIRICDAWRNSFEAFLEGVGEPPHSGVCIDRINNDGDYEPGNVRWTDRATNQQNRRVSRYLTIDGVTKCVAEWARQPGAVSDQAIRHRLRIGWGASRAVFQPSRGQA